MCVSRQRLAVSNTVVRRARGEIIVKDERAQRRVPTGTAAANGQPLAINFALPGQEARRADAVLDVDNAPLAA